MSSLPLRIAIVTEGAQIAGWQATLIRRLVADTSMAIVAVLNSRDTARDRAAAFSPESFWSTACDWIDRVVENWRYAGFWKNVDIDPDAVIDIATIQGLPGVQSVKAGAGNWSLGGSQVVLDLRARGRPGVGSAESEAAGVPIVRLSQPCGGYTRLGLAEIATDAPYVHLAAVVAPANGGREKVLQPGTFVTFRYSWNANRRRLLHKSAFLLHDALRRLQRDGAPTRVCVEPATLLDAQPAEIPAAFGPGLLGATFGRIMRRAWSSRRQRQQWRLLTSLSDKRPDGLAEMDVHIPPKGLFWADPFLVRRGGADWMFFEEYDFATGRGTIAAGRLHDRALKDVRTVLSPAHHVSYPFLFEHKGELFMVPETHKKRAIELWRCCSFPDRWELARPLVEGVSAADATLLEHDGVWWMFANVDRSGLDEHADELHIFSTDDPVAGTWRPHPANPVITDARCARMAGAVTRCEAGRLLRPAQIGGDVYGSGMRFFEITALTETIYREAAASADMQLGWMSNVPRLHHCHAYAHGTAADLCVSMPVSSG